MIERGILVALFLLGFFGLATQRNLVKKVFSLSVQNSAIVLLFIVEGGRIGSAAPLHGSASGESFVDPLPQALMLTAIVVGVCVSALAVALAYRLFRIYGTLDADELRRRMRHE